MVEGPRVEGRKSRARVKSRGSRKSRFFAFFKCILCRFQDNLVTIPNSEKWKALLLR